MMTIKTFLFGGLAALSLSATGAYAENIGFVYNGERFDFTKANGTIYDLSRDGFSTPDRLTLEVNTYPYLKYLGIYGGGVEFDGAQISGFLETEGGEIVGGVIDALNGKDTFHLDIANQIVLATVNGRVCDFDQRDGVTEAGSFLYFTEYPSGAPEPGVWAQMIAGVGVIGATLRFGRRGREKLAAA